MKEIGGYLELEENHGKEYYDYLSFNSSRNSLQFIVRKRNINKIYLPYYVCLVIEETLQNENVDIIYYHIDNNFKPLIDNYDGKSYVYIVNFFGLLSKKDLLDLSNIYDNRVIIDNTHGFFMEGFNNIDCIYNCRKYFGVPDGSYLYTDLEYDDEYPIASSMSRIKHLFGRYESKASDYYKEFVDADETFDNRDIELMSKITHNMLKGINYDFINNQRVENFRLLNNALSDFNELSFDLDVTPDYMYPLLVQNGSNLKKKLISNKIFVPTLWPGLDKFELNDFEKRIFYDLVLLPIDQRYNKEDMKYIIKIVKENI